MDQDERIKQLEAENVGLKAALAAALKRIARLEKNSSNSSKPPSSDIVTPRPACKTRKGKRRKPGGQKGRKACVRPPFPAEEVDHVVDHFWEGIDSRCFRRLRGQFSSHQQVELVRRPFEVTQHRFQKYLDLRTGRTVVTPRPREVRLGLFGPRMLALTTCLKADLHGSYAAIQTLLSDALGLKVSVGFLAKATQKVAHALDATYDHLKHQLRQQAVVNVDETGHKECGERWWAWVGTSRRLTVFQVVKGRGTDQLHQLLGKDFNAVLCSDSFSVYVKNARLNPKVETQFCWAHLVRDVRFVEESGDRLSRVWAAKLLAQIKAMFRAWHRGQIAACRRACDGVLRRCRTPGRGVDARRLGKRVTKQRDGYTRFLDVPSRGIEPTNNAAERQVRPLVIHRRVTQGTRGQAGRRWWERVFSVRATCRQQGRSAFEFMVAAVEAMTQQQPAPELIQTR